LRQVLRLCSDLRVFRALYGLTAVLLGVSLVAQTVPISPLGSTSGGNATDSKVAEKQEAFVIEQNHPSESCELDGTGNYETSSRVRLQSEAGVQQFGLLSAAYQKNFQTADFEYVRVRKPDGTVINTPLTEIQDIVAPITRAAPFYSDLREKHIAVKGVAVGDVVEWRTVYHTFKAIVPGQFWSGYSFSKGAVILDEQFRLSVPKSMF
jgi:hypothetical protein